ncbi:UNVERIFIED_CONTAM: hypothetical protein HHA_243390 [Hammondia hammondi]|eukprot:XP_008884355.1 hypothetical protein HHA_243390 [Hammondia hammondi]
MPQRVFPLPTLCFPYATMEWQTPASGARRLVYSAHGSPGKESFVGAEYLVSEDAEICTEQRLFCKRRKYHSRATLQVLNVSMLLFAPFLASFAACAPSSPSLAPFCGSSSSPSAPLLSGRVAVPPQLLSGLRISVNGDFLSVSPSSSGDFSLPCLPVGSYLLQPSHPLLVFPSYRLTVSHEAVKPDEAAKTAYRARVFLLGESLRPLTDVPLPLPLRLVPATGPPAYFVVKPPFSLLFLLQQPLLLVAAALFGLMWCLPKLQQFQEEERQQRLLAHEHQQALRASTFEGRHAQSSGPRRGAASEGEAHLLANGDAGRLGVEDEDTSAFLKALAALRDERACERR